jgi:hypothetical protein
VQPRLPTGLLANYLNALEVEDPRISQRAINYLNDGARSIAYICFQPNVIACSVLTLAARDFDLDLPSEDEDGFCWWKVFDVENETDIDECSRMIKSVYSLTPYTRQELEYVNLFHPLDKANRGGDLKLCTKRKNFRVAENHGHGPKQSRLE